MNTLSVLKKLYNIRCFTSGVAVLALSFSLVTAPVNSQPGASGFSVAPQSPVIASLGQSSGSRQNSSQYNETALENQPLYREVLPNGLTVLLKNSSASPTVSLNIFVKAGGFEETEETMGISHFYEHLFFRGTPTLSGHQFKRAIEALGGQTNANTGRDFTHYFINMPSKNVEAGLKLLADALINSELDSEAIDQERKAVLEEYRMGLENPMRNISERMSDMAYPHHPYGRPVIGTEVNIRAFTQADFEKFRETFISPERITVIVTGDFSSARIMPVIREEFGTFKRRLSRPLARPSRVRVPQQEEVSVESLPINTSFVVLGYVGPSVKDKPDIYTADVLSFMLGVGRGSLIQRALVKKELVLDGGVDFLTQRFPGLISVYAVTKPGKESQAKQELLKVVEQLKSGNFSDKDLARAKNYLSSHYVLGAESNSGKADNLGFYASIDDVSFAASYLKNIEKVTRQDVIKAAVKYLGEGHYCMEMRGSDKPKTPNDKAQDEEKRPR